MAPILSARNLSKTFGERHAVRDVSLEIAGGEIVGLLGPNGAGKTTTLRMVCGLTRPSAGTAMIGGIDVWGPRADEAKGRTGYLDEEPFTYPNLTGREFLDLVCDLYRVPRGPERRRHLDSLLTGFELADHADDLVGGYSHGQRQKLGLASLLVHDPDLYLLDEPTNGLDPRSARRVKDLLGDLAGRGKAVVLSTHILEIAQALCTRVAIMNQGTVVAAGSLEELRRTAGQGEASLEELFLQLTGGPEQREVVEHLLG